MMIDSLGTRRTLAFCVLLHLLLRLRAATPAAAAATPVANTVTVNYNMICTLVSNLRRQQLPTRPHVPRLLPRAAAAYPAQSQLVQFNVLLHNASSVTQIDLYVHPRFESTAYQPAIEPAPLALEVARFGKCEDYNQFRMHPICKLVKNVSHSDEQKLQPYLTMCRDSIGWSAQRSVVNSIYALHHPRLDRYMCLAKDGKSYTSTTLKADCFFFIRQVSDTRPQNENDNANTCYVGASKRFRQSALMKQVRASDYYLLMSAVYPRLVNDSNAACTVKGMAVTFGAKKRWLLGVSFAGTAVIRQRFISTNTMWKFDTIASGPDRNVPKLERITTPTTTTTTTSTTVRTSTRNSSTTSTTTTNSRPVTSSRVASATPVLTARRDRSRARNVVPIEQSHLLADRLLVGKDEYHHRSFVDQLLQSANITLQDAATADRINEDIATAAHQQRRNPRARARVRTTQQ